MIRRPPRSTRTDTLSLHDALPICLGSSVGPTRRIGQDEVRPGVQWQEVGSAEVAVVGYLPISKLDDQQRSEEHTSELQSLMRISYAVFCLKKKNQHNTHSTRKP